MITLPYPDDSVAFVAGCLSAPLCPGTQLIVNGGLSLIARRIWGKAWHISAGPYVHRSSVVNHAASFVINLSSHVCIILSLKVKGSFSSLIFRRLLHGHF